MSTWWRFRFGLKGFPISSHTFLFDRTVKFVHFVGFRDCLDVSVTSALRNFFFIIILCLIPANSELIPVLLSSPILIDSDMKNSHFPTLNSAPSVRTSLRPILFVENLVVFLTLCLLWICYKCNAIMFMQMFIRIRCAAIPLAILLLCGAFKAIAMILETFLWFSNLTTPSSLHPF